MNFSKTNLLIFLLSLTFYFSILEKTKAEVIPDSTLGKESTVVNETNTQSGIFSDLQGGATRGQNLFHSLKIFNLNKGDEANVENPFGIKRVFIRVTGGSSSLIDGKFSSNGNASIYLINQNGLFIRNNAVFNVGGALVLTTTSKINFTDGYSFSASGQEERGLTESEPSFLSFNINSSPISIIGNGYQSKQIAEIQGAPIAFEFYNNGTIHAGSGESISLIGNGISLKGGVFTSDTEKINFISIKDGDVYLDKAYNLNFSRVKQFNNITLEDHSLLFRTGFGGGSINLTGENIDLNQSAIYSRNYGTNDSGNINIFASGDLTITGINPLNRSGALSENLSSANGASITIDANNLILNNYAGLTTTSFLSGKGGDINLNINNNIYENSSSAAVSLTFGTSQAGNVDIKANNISLYNGSIIASNTFGKGDSGLVNITALNKVVISGFRSSDFFPSIINSSSFGPGNSSGVNIQANDIFLENGGRIGASALNSGNGGNIKITATNSVEVTGHPFGSVNPTTIDASSSVLDPSLQAIFNLPAFPTGDAGNLNIITNLLKISDGARVSVQSDGTGEGGTAKIRAKIILLNNGKITAFTRNNNGGNLDIFGDNIILRQNSSISASAGGGGNGGNTFIQSNVLAGDYSSTIQSDAVFGKGGNTTINTDALIFNRQNITAASEKDITSNGTVQINSRSFAPSQKLARDFLRISQTNTINCSHFNPSSSFYTIEKDFTEGLDDSLDLNTTRSEDRYFMINGEKIKDISIEGWVRNPDGTAHGSPSNIGFSGNSHSPFGCNGGEKIAQLPPRNNSPKPHETPKLFTPPNIPILNNNDNTDNNEKSLENLNNVIVREFKFTGNTIVTTKELNYLVGPYIGKPLSIPELNSILASITKLYVDRGYINSGARALVKDNLRIDPNNATILIRIIEGHLGKVHVFGSKRMARQIEWQLQDKKPLNKNNITKRLVILQENLPIEKLDVKLIPSDAANIADIEVTVKASNPYKISAFANNYQNPSVGAEQYGVDFFATNPTTLGDKLRLSYSQSEASSLVSASYSLPILKDDTRIEVSISHGRNKVITSPLKDLDIKSSSTDWRIGINHPIVNKASPDSRFKFGIGLSFDSRKTKESLLGFDFPISAGSDNNGRRNINTLTVSQNLLYRGKNQAFHLESGLDIGLNSLTGSGYANNQALSFHVEHEYIHKMPWNTFFIANGGFQFAPSPLVVDRQISLGGIGSVRGIQQDITNNDNGIYEQVSFKKEFKLGKYGIFSTAPFFDIGLGWNSTKDDNSSKLLFSSGVALEYTFHDNISANITFAMPLSHNIGNIQVLAGVKIQF